MRTLCLLVFGCFVLCRGVAAQETELDHALEIAVRDTSQRLQFYGEFLNALVYVPVSASPAVPSAGQASLQPLTMEDERGAYVAAFDRLDRLQAWAPAGTRHVAVAASSLLQSVVEEHAGTRLFLNAGTGHSWEFQPQELDWLLRSLRASQPTATVARNTEVVIGSAATDAPQPLVDALVSHLAGEPDVHEAYLSQFALEGGKMGLFLVLRLDDEAANRLPSIRERIAESVQDVLPEGGALSVGLYSKTGITQTAPREGRLIYKR